MNASLPASGLPSAVEHTTHPRRRSILFSLTGVCFLFGGLLAMQLRAIQGVHQQQEEEKVRVAAEQKISNSLRAKAAEDAAKLAAQNRDIENLKRQLAASGKISKGQLAALNTQLNQLKQTAGLTPMSGAGIRIVMSDNPAMVEAGGNPSLMQPGLVHDFDLLQVVNELRASKADAIAIRGAGGDPIRITGTTPIRCVGSTIQINWNPVAAPFTIEAIGNPKTLRSALEMPQGVVDNLRGAGAIGVKVASVENLEMPAGN